MKKVKSMLFASAVLGTIGLASNVSANSGVNTFISDYNQYDGTYTVQAVQEEGGKTISKIDMAIWSEEDGQDDIKWYSVQNNNSKNVSFKFDVANHNRRAGTYNTHVFVTYTDGTKDGRVLEQKVISTSGSTISQNGNKITLHNKILPQNGTISTAVWSEENGQDDIKWYNADNNGDAIVDLTSHKGYGKYNIHTYVFNNGTATGVGVQTYDVAKPELQYQITRIQDTQYRVTISNVPNEMKLVYVPTWTEINGQDDSRWYVANKISDGTYQVDIPLKNHNFEVGQYSMHIYGYSNTTNKLEGLAITPGFVPGQISNFEKPSVKIVDHKPNEGLLTVNVKESDYSKKIKEIKVAAWSEPNQTNLKWYNVTPSGLDTNIKVDVKNHGNKSGQYPVHTYIYYTDGSSDFIVLPTTQLNAVSTSGKIDAGTPDSLNTYPVGQCTWGVRKQASWVGNYWGNAKDWIGSARAQGFTVNQTPAVGAVAVWPRDGVIGGVVYGHVAYVVDVESATKIQVKESNYAGRMYVGNFRGWFNPKASTWGGEVYYIHPKK
ncbi:GBS Bsp-like repeat-containing protein [Streptococcus caprae]|uniref:GBS Bsp-like repeat-containing protein n=1 Tax=Streptococcus caprae TaxID=1640501 RepID=A0ABV8CUY9_9STRE